MIPDVLASTAGGSVPGFYGKNRAWYESIQSSSQMGAAQVKSQVKNRMSLTVQLLVLPPPPRVKLPGSGFDSDNLII